MSTVGSAKSTRVRRKTVDVVGKSRSCLMIRSRAELSHTNPTRSTAIQPRHVDIDRAAYEDWSNPSGLLWKCLWDREGGSYHKKTYSCINILLAPRYARFQ